MVASRVGAVYEWPDAPGSATETCRECGESMAVLAAHPVTGALCGRDRCPKCKTMRRIPEERHEMMVQWSGIPLRVIRKAVDRGMDESTAENVAMMAYVEAVLRWVPERASLSTLATYHVTNAVRCHATMGVKRNAKHLRQLAAMGGNGLSHHTFGHHDPEVAPADSTAEEVAEFNRDAVWRALARLHPRERLVVTRRFGLDGEPPETLEQVAARIGVSKERVRQLQKRALISLERDQQFSTYEVE